MRHFAPLLFVAALLAGCATADTPGEPVDLSGLRETVAEVNELHATGQSHLAVVLEAVRELDLVIERFRDPSTVDDARDAWPPIGEAIDQIDIDDLREPFFALALAVDRARGELQGALDGVEEEWQRRALEAEDEALVTIRAYAEEADRLARVLITHWPTYHGIAAETDGFVEQRWFYRDSQEAADAFELAVSSYLDPLVIAQDEIGEALERRDDAAEQVNEALETARQRWDERPAAPTPGGGEG